ncbi:MAG: hypothetical protein ABJA60_04295, partial [Nitrosospira sp.]
MLRLDTHIAHILARTYPNCLGHVKVGARALRNTKDIPRHRVDPCRLGIAGMHGNGGMNKD